MGRDGAGRDGRDGTGWVGQPFDPSMYRAPSPARTRRAHNTHRRSLSPPPPPSAACSVACAAATQTPPPAESSPCWRALRPAGRRVPGAGRCRGGVGRWLPRAGRPSSLFRVPGATRCRGWRSGRPPQPHRSTGPYHSWSEAPACGLVRDGEGGEGALVWVRADGGRGRAWPWASLSVPLGPFSLTCYRLAGHSRCTPACVQVQGHQDQEHQRERIEDGQDRGYGWGQGQRGDARRPGGQRGQEEGGTLDRAQWG
jgi:hypothetical protein